MKVLFLMVARGGSKGVPGKNLRTIGGIPLVGFKAISARRSKYCDRLIISTDSVDIQELARGYGVEVPFTRPAELATDTASTFDVIAHAMAWIEAQAGGRYDAVMLLEPSAPFTRAVDYDNAVELMMKHDADVVVGVRRMEVPSVFVGPLDEQGRITRIVEQMQTLRSVRRQDQPQDYTMNGGLYLFKWDFFNEHGTIYQDGANSYGYVMERHYSVEIDEPGDLEWAEFLVSKGHIDLAYWQ